MQRCCWDSCVFLSFLNNEPLKGDIVQAHWDNIETNPNAMIYTSTLSIAEIAFLGIERKKLLPAMEARFDKIWNDPKLTIINLSRQIAQTARSITRKALEKGWALKPNDSVQLGTAKWLHENVEKLEGFYTFDQRLFKFESLIGLPIIEPTITMP